MKETREKLRQDKSAFLRMMAKIEIEGTEVEVSSKIVAEFIKVDKSFGSKTILDKFSLRIMRGDRIGVLGKNGSGKSTFLKLLVGELQPDMGKVKISKDLEFSYFDQNRQALDLEASLWSTLCPSGGDHIEVMGKSRHVCGYLKDFLFDPEMARHSVKTLSGGQKNRLLLAKVLADPKSFLILDEPTNDLDMDTLDMLEEIIANYQGTLILVSHDRDFLDQTVSKILAFEGDGVIDGCIGGYSDYLEMVSSRRTPSEPKLAASKSSAQASVVIGETPPTKKLSYKLQYELENLPKGIAALESEIEDISRKLEDADLYSRDPVLFQTYSARLPLAEHELEAAETRWLELEEMRSSLA